MLIVIILLFCVGLVCAQYQNVYQSKSIYWSNCLIEAVRAWIVDFADAEILYCAPMRNEVLCPHQMWETRDGLKCAAMGNFMA